MSSGGLSRRRETPQPGDDDDGDNGVVDEFTRYLERAKERGVMPKDWSETDDEGLVTFATGAEGIYFAIEKSDIVERFGNALGEHFVLRSLAESVLGPMGCWPIDDEDDDDDDDDDDEDEDDEW